MFEYVGAIHMHSIYSDGSGEVEDITTAASEIGLDYIILTDHNTLRALNEGYEKWYKNTLLLVGCEVNDKQNINHYLAFGIDEAFSTRLSAKQYVKKVKDAGGIGFIAHPLEKRTHMKEHPSYPWIEWDTEDFTGMEIWNQMSEWMENLTEQNKYQAFLHPLKSIIAPTEETLKVWDDLNIKRKVVAIGGVDAHAHKYNLQLAIQVVVYWHLVQLRVLLHRAGSDDVHRADEFAECRGRRAERPESTTSNTDGQRTNVQPHAAVYPAPGNRGKVADLSTREQQP